MTLQVSKDKLRRLPYEARLNMIKHQPDFAYEIGMLIKDYPEREHPDAENMITSKSSVTQIISFIRRPETNTYNMCRGLCERLKLEAQGDYPSIRLMWAVVIKNDLPPILNNVDDDDILELLTDTLLFVNEQERQHQEGYSYTGLNCLMGIFIKLYKRMDYNKIADAMLPYLGHDTVYAHIKELYRRVDDEQFRSRIIDAIQIHDIIT